MTKAKALKIMLQIIYECSKHESTDTSCTECPFGNGGRCMVSAGNDVPPEWNINEKIRELMR